MKIKVYTLNSFAKTKEGGNPVGVVMNADSLSKEQMRKRFTIKSLEFLQRFQGRCCFNNTR